MAINASIATVGLVKFDGTGNFGLWQRRVKDLLVQQGLVKALYGKTKKPEKMTDDEWEELDIKAVSTIRLLLADEIMYDVMEENSIAGIWLNLEKRYMSKSLTNKLHLKQKLYGLKMTEGADLRQHINTFKQIISDMLRIDIKFEDEDKAMMLLISLPASYEHLVTTLLYGKETLELKEVSGALLDHYQRKHKDSAESSSEGLVVKGYQDRGRKKDKDDKSARGRSKSKSKTVKCFKCQKKGHMKRDCPEWNKGKEESSTSVNVVADSESDGDMLSVSSSTDGLNNSWLLDSACSFHVTTHRNWFDTYRSINCVSVRMGNDAACTIMKRKDPTKESKEENKGNNFSQTFSWTQQQNTAPMIRSVQGGTVNIEGGTYNATETVSGSDVQIDEDKKNKKKKPEVTKKIQIDDLFPP